MQKLVLIFLSVLVYGFSDAQTVNPKNIRPDSSNYKNVYVKKISEDANQSTFIIWVKDQVRMHYHKNHTEIITVISGKGRMTVGDSVFEIRKGVTFTIPMGELHAVTTTSHKPLKVISIQCPKFDGDRIWIESEK